MSFECVSFSQSDHIMLIPDQIDLYHNNINHISFIITAIKET